MHTVEPLESLTSALGSECERTVKAHIELLGHVGVRSGLGHTVVSGKPAAILAMLALRRGPVSVSRLVEILWSDPPDKEVNALQRHVSRLRSVLAEHGEDDVIAHVGGSYELDRQRVTVDIDELESQQHGNASFAARWWLEPLATVDHVDFIAERRRLEVLCGKARDRALACHDINVDSQPAAAVPSEVVRELRRWLDLRPADDEVCRVVRDWLAQVSDRTG